MTGRAYDRAPMRACLIVSGREIPVARVLADAVLAHHPEAEVIVVIADPGAAAPEDLPGAVRVLRPADVGIDDATLEILAGRHEPDVLRWSLLPFALRALGEDGAPVVHLSPEAIVTGPLDDVLDLLSDHEVALVATMLEPLPDDGLLPTNTDVAEVVGVVDRCLIGWRSGPVGDELLDQWPTVLQEDDPKGSTVPRDAFQRWLDGRPAASPRIGLLRHPGYGVGFWNVPLRSIAGTLQAPTCDGVPIRLLSVRDFDPRRPERTPPRQQRIRLSRVPVLAGLLQAHATALLEAGWVEADERSDPWSVLPDGSTLNYRLRTLFGKGVDVGVLTRGPFDEEGQEAFYAWASEPAKAGGAAGINRLHFDIWLDRHDLQGAYPHLNGPDGPGYAGWVWIYGREQEGVPDRLLPPLPAHVDDPDAAGAPLAWGVNVAGFFSSELGLGEAARLLVGALDAAHVPALPVQGMLVPPSRQEAEFQFSTPDDAPFPINILCLNGDMVPLFAREVGEEFFRDRYTIALWWWEVGSPPVGWQDAFRWVDEVWVATEHVRSLIAPTTTKAVTHVPMPVRLPPICDFRRADLGLPEGFLFLYIYDYHSTEARKNPTGLVEAFKRAFPPGSGAKLALKCINAKNLADAHERVLLAIGDHPDIVVLDEYVTADEKNAMLATCDCYVSPHRSEGFGLTPAEAMLLGRPVIATNYGGTLDFTTPENAYLIDYEPVAVGPDAAPYPASAMWADPDVEQLAATMRHVFEHPDEARRRGERAREDIEARHSPEAAGRAMEERLHMIHARLSEDRDPDRDRGHRRNGGPNRTLDALREAVEAGAPQPAPGGQFGAVARQARGAALRLIRDFAAAERRIDAGMLDQLEHLAEQVTRVQAELHAREAETMANFRRLGRELADERKRNALLSSRLERHLAEHAAEPWVEAGYEPERWRDPIAGRVYGYRGGGADEESYVAFEDAFRGGRARVRSLSAAYLPLLESCAPVLDAGCGRGELLELLGERGVQATGVDADEAMVARAVERGLAVTVADVNEHLAELHETSLGAVVSIEVVEHLAYPELRRFLELSASRLRPGGLLVVETVNPHALSALKTFWMDPTHHHPLFPEALLELTRSTGFASAYVFHPTGGGDVDVDRLREPTYALVATR